MTDLSASKTQSRVAALVGLTHDETYAGAGRALEGAGLPLDGIPAGQTWRTVAKMTDAGLLALLPMPAVVQLGPAPTRDNRNWYQRAKERAGQTYELVEDTDEVMGHAQ